MRKFFLRNHLKYTLLYLNLPSGNNPERSLSALVPLETRNSWALLFCAKAWRLPMGQTVQRVFRQKTGLVTVENGRMDHLYIERQYWDGKFGSRPLSPETRPVSMCSTCAGPWKMKRSSLIYKRGCSVLCRCRSDCERQPSDSPASS